MAEFAADGGPVVGICNGFQVLTEAGLLPGALQKNRGSSSCAPPWTCGSSRSDSVLTSARPWVDVLRIPINHFEGNYTCAPETLAELQAEDRVVLRYVDNPNGSVDDIAGISNAGRNVVGLMPHPERAVGRAARQLRRPSPCCARSSTPRPRSGSVAGPSDQGGPATSAVMPAARSTASARPPRARRRS